MTQKLRLKGSGFGAAGTGEHLNLQFVPTMPKADWGRCCRMTHSQLT